MKTIFIPIFQGQQARNIFLTGIFTRLKNLPDCRLVIFTKPEKVLYYKDLYGSDRVDIVGFNLPSWTHIESKWQNLFLIGIDSSTIKLRQLKAYYEGGSFVSYLIKRFFTKIIGRFHWLKNIWRWLDQKMFYQSILEPFFESYQPVLVFCPNVSGKFDLLFLKTAKKLGVKTVGLVNSWDNLSSRGLIRSLPEELIVHNEDILSEAVTLQGFDKSKIEVIGLPHFDHYVNDKRSPRADFFKRLGIDPSREVLLFCPAGSRMSQKEWRIIQLIDGAIKDGRIKFAAHILVRLPPNADLEMGDLKASQNITFDKPGFSFTSTDPNDWEWTFNDMNHLADTLFYSRMMIGYASTMTIDVAAFDRPIINVDFELPPAVKPYLSYSWFYYHTTHYLSVLSDGGICMVDSEQELIMAINKYFSCAYKDKIGRSKIVETQCWKLDGRAGERLVDFLIKNKKTL